MRASEQPGSKPREEELIAGEPQFYVVSFKDLLRRKGIHFAVFQRDANLTEDSPIENHVAFIYDHILSLPYASVCQGDFSRTNAIARMLHGVQHAVRVAKLVMVFANLFRRHGDPQALALTEAKIKHMQIMALFHDSAREDDLKDDTDHESAIILYHYLTRVVGMKHEDAVFYAEIVANKEAREQQARCILWFGDNNEFHGYIKQVINGQALPRACAELEALYDGDCLDVLRARVSYRGETLNFYQHIVSVLNSKLALEEVAHLICEWRSILEIQGDSYKRWDIDKKRFYEHRDAWERMEDSIKYDMHPIVNALSRKLLSVDELRTLQLIDISPYNPELGLTESNLRAAMREGRVFLRSVCSPSAYKKTHPDETMAAFELRKLFRQFGLPANSRLNASREKSGNRNRSSSMFEKAAGSFGRAGFLFLNPRLSSIKLVATKNMRTGFGKKTEFLTLFAQQPAPSVAEIERRLQDLALRLKLGGDGAVIGKTSPHVITHPEVVCDLESVDAVYYTTDPTMYREYACKPFQESTKHAALIEAIYLRKLYRQFYLAGLAMMMEALGEERGRSKFIERFGDTPDLPMFFVSGVHHVVHRIPDTEFSDDHIMMYWRALMHDYLKNTQRCLMTDCILDVNLDQLKIAAVSGNEATKHIAYMGPADECYDDQLKRRLNRELAVIILERIADIEIEYCGLVADGTLSTKDEKIKATFLSAVRHGHKNIVCMLLGMDRMLCEASYNGLYPIHLAAVSHQPEIVQILLEHFAHPDTPGPQSVRALHFAVNNQDEEVVRQLLSKACVNYADEDGITPLMIAAAKDNTRLMTILLSAHAKVNVLTPKNDSALSYAIANQSHNAINLLLGCKLDLSSQEAIGRAVIAAVDSDMFDVIDLLAQKGADLPAALQYAVSANHYEACFTLLAKGVNCAGVTLDEGAHSDIVSIIHDARCRLFIPSKN